jgi:hypothetical protein
MLRCVQRGAPQQRTIQRPFIIGTSELHCAQSCAKHADQYFQNFVKLQEVSDDKKRSSNIMTLIFLF